MKRFKLTYNGVVSIFNARRNGGEGKVLHEGNKVASWWVYYTALRGAANTLRVYELVEIHESDGTVKYGFRARVPVERGHAVHVKELSE